MRLPVPTLDLRRPLAALTLCLSAPLWAAPRTEVIDIPTRAGVTVRTQVITPEHPRATLVLLAGGHGGLQLSAQGAPTWGAGNFVVRIRDKLADRGLVVALVDAPSDRQQPPFLGGWRQTPEHAQDLSAVMAWLRHQSPLPVWLVGTSRGTQSAAFVATELPPGTGPDGLVLTATILRDDKGRAVPRMPLERLRMPVLVLHHEADACSHCPASELPSLMQGLSASPRTELSVLRGGNDRGDPCEAAAHHGFNGLDGEAANLIADWVLQSPPPKAAP